MPVRPIVLYPDPVLLHPTRPVEQVDDDLRTLVTDMVDTMYAAPGIGLAANQVGDSRRVCIVDLSVGEDPDGLLVLINPRVVSTGEPEVAEEGCLSFPDVLLDVRRPVDVTVEAVDLDGTVREIDVTGLLGRVILHECEHLDGQTFLRNVSALKRELVKKEIRKRIKAGDWVESAAT